MTRFETLKARMHIEGGVVPINITSLRITLEHTPDAIARGITARVGGEIEVTLGDVTPLFAAGFGAAEGLELGATAAITCHSTITANGIQVDVAGAAHSPLLPYLLVRIIEGHSQTPEGAFERLLDMMDGDEDMARAVFKPLVFANDVESLTIQTAPASPQTPTVLLDMAVPVRADVAALIARLGADAEQIVLSMPDAAMFNDALDHGFLTLQDQGHFQPFGARPSNPEIYMNEGALIVEDWVGAPLFLAELARVIAGGEVAGISIIKSGDEGPDVFQSE